MPMDHESLAGTQEDFSLIDLFEMVIELHADRVAVVCGSDTITYGKLNRAADAMAQRLRGIGIESTSIVAIYLDRSIEILIAMLGILKAGNTYLPIDPTYPVARVVQTLEDAQPAVLITDRQLASGLPGIAPVIVYIDTPYPAAPNQTSAGTGTTRPDDVAYVMYTSGSTGKPKGVLVTHRNVVRLLQQTDRWFNFDENDVWTMFHSFAFDFSVWEIWGPLLTGGRLVIVPFAVSRSPEDFYRLLSEQKITVLNQTPSAFALLTQLEDSGMTLPLSLRVVIFGGEALQYRSLRTWFQRHGDETPRLINMYGITETTVHVTYRQVREADAQTEYESLIGVPIPDMQIHLLGDNGRPVTDGEVGEICVAGGGVARGYLNRPELTAERFVPDPFGTSGAMMYRSGDLAQRRADGELVYLGRRDGQVKINGFRIELGEVEAAITEYPGVRQTCVLAHTDASGSSRLAAYFVAAGSSPIPTSDLSHFLARKLPPQMLPAFYTQIETMPLTGNGKIDRNALPKPMTGSKAGVFESETPLQEQVAAIWRTVLNTQKVGLDDNFFDIGGSSLLLIETRKLLQEGLGRPVPITALFEFTTVRALARQFEEQSSNTTKSHSEPVESSNQALSAVQDQARKQRDAFARIRSAKGVTR